MRKDFYIFRHGESSYNLVGRIQGRTNDSVLTERGKLQATEVGKFLANKRIGIIVTSPLKRAMQTAEIAKKFLNVPIVEDEHFTEVNVGVIEGLHYTEATAKYGEDYVKWRNRENLWPDFCFEGGESKSAVKKRVFEGLHEWAENSDYEAIAIASHGIMLGQTLIAIGVADQEVDNGSILHISYDNGQWQFVEMVSVNKESWVVR